MRPRLPKPFLTPIRSAALVAVVVGILLHLYEIRLFEALPFPKRFLAPPLIWSCASYVVAAALACTRQPSAAAAFAVSALILDLTAHYLVYIRLYVPRRYDLPGWPVYLMPALSLLVVGPMMAFAARWVARRAESRRREHRKAP